MPGGEERRLQRRHRAERLLRHVPATQKARGDALKQHRTRLDATGIVDQLPGPREEGGCGVTSPGFAHCFDGHELVCELAVERLRWRSVGAADVNQITSLAMSICFHRAAALVLHLHELVR